MHADVNSPSFWNSSYQNDRSPWDLGGPTPAFRRLAESGDFPPGELIVLGAGRGHDARLFARAGFAVTAVDFAQEAVAAMRALAEPDAPVTVAQADLFDLPAAWHGRFDYVLEYTCFCAIDPARRDEYAGVVSRLLRPGGMYIAMAFPIGTRPGGPPFVVSPDGLIARLARHGFVLQHREWPADSVPARRGVEELLILQKQPQS